MEFKKDYIYIDKRESKETIKVFNQLMFENTVKDTSTRSDIPKGMKLIKAFKYFESNKMILEDMQNLASQYIQENKIKGTLCFSVHPLDFLSSSENTYNWRSCHALDGEYKAGNLSYMTDNTTFMVYLKGADNELLPNFPSSVKWNSKKWRMLIHSSWDDAIMFAGRQYPFASKPALDLVLNIYNGLMEQDKPKKSPWYPDNIYEEWDDTYIASYTRNSDNKTKELSSIYLPYNSYLLSLEDVVVEGSGALNYNDVLHSSCYQRPYYAILHRTWGGDRSPKQMVKDPLFVGGPAICLECGMDDIEDSGYMRCSDCEYRYGNSDDDCYTYCSCCNTRLYSNDCYYVDDEPICDSCFENECFYCERCGEAHFNDDDHVITVGENDKAEILHLCKYCYEEYLDEKENK